MPLPTQLIDLRLRLESVGMIIVEEPDHLNVRLPFFCSVRVYSDGDHLRFESYFGVVPRVKATVLKLGVPTVLAIGSGHYGIGYAGALALLAIVAGIYDSIRWQLTEHAITRVSTITSLVAIGDAPGRRLVATGSQSLRSTESSSTTPADRLYVRDRRDD